MKGKIRLSPEEKEAFVEIAKIVLKVALIGLAVGIFLTSPTGLSRLVPELIKLRKKYGDKVVDKSLEKIFKDRFVKVIKKKDKTILKITEKGRVKLVSFNIDTIQIQNRRWDGRWRFVFFDIPEKKRIARDVLRDKLKQIGFIKVQKSVWVCPYECKDEISFISSIYGVEPYVNYIIADEVDNDALLRSEFGME